MPLLLLLPLPLRLPLRPSVAHCAQEGGREREGVGWGWSLRATEPRTHTYDDDRCCLFPPVLPFQFGPHDFSQMLSAISGNLIKFFLLYHSGQLQPYFSFFWVSKIHERLRDSNPSLRCFHNTWNFWLSRIKNSNTKNCHVYDKRWTWVHEEKGGVAKIGGKHFDPKNLTFPYFWIPAKKTESTITDHFKHSNGFTAENFSFICIRSGTHVTCYTRPISTISEMLQVTCLYCTAPVAKKIQQDLLMRLGPPKMYPILGFKPSTNLRL